MNSDAGDNLGSILRLPYQQIFDAMPGYALVVGRNFRIVECNRKFFDDFGDVRGKPCFEVLRKKDGRCGVCNVERTFLDGKENRCEQQMLRPDGTRVNVVVNTVPIKNPGGEVVAVMAMYTDITQAVRLKDELIESEKRFRDLFEKVPCYISVQDKDLQLVSVNEAFQQDFGEKEGKYCYELYKHRTEPCMDCPVLETFRDGQEHTREEVVTTLSGERKNVLVKSTPMFNDDGEVEYVMEMSSDITEIRQLQDQLQSLGMLVGTISHGIKGVLTGLDGGMYMMNSGFKKDDVGRIKKGWEMIRRNVFRIRSMVMDVLYYAKDRDPILQEIQPHSIADEVCGLLEEKAAEIKVDFQKELVDVGEILADPKAIHSMLVNLIDNSIDACRVDKEKTEHWVKIELGQDNDHVVFEVSDNGIGMDQETRERVFSLFFSSKGAEGTGLGLFISNKIAVKHGGRIEVESEPNKGTHFTVRIPKSQPE
jgi:PAS domain S-box-containing protein